MNEIKLHLHCVESNDRFNIKETYEQALAQNEEIINILQKGECSHMLGWKCLTTNQNQVVKDIEEYCDSVRENIEDFIVLGVGGSALGAKTIFNSLCSCVHNALPREKRKAPRFFVLDNIDPCELNEVLEIVNLEKTLVNVVSKSGTTTESMSQFLTFYERIKEVVGEEKVNSHFVFTTDEEKGILCDLKNKKGFKAFYVPSGVGGRFSVLSPVGLLPACILGIDISELLNGALEMQKRCEKKKECNPAYQKAVLEYVLNKNGRNMIVTMPYASKLKEYSYWYAQLLGESIGKETDRDGNQKNCGITPVSALGATDQHSQLQLYMEGPQDKLLVAVKVKDFGTKLSCPNYALDTPELEHLKNVEFGNLINTERKATLCGLAHSGIPFIEIEVPQINANVLGGLFMLNMYEIAFLGELFNIDAYNQPGVEFGKKVTLANLGIEKYAQYLQSCSFLEDNK